jgi:hypothetical protein
MCRASISNRLFQNGWGSLDHLLLCSSAAELQKVLLLVHDRNLQ